MSDLIRPTSVGDAGHVEGDMARYMPEPAVKNTKSGPAFVDSALDVGRGLTGALAGVTLDPSFVAMLELQRQMQLEMQAMTTLSNVSKTKHEAAMAPIRNLRAG